MEQLKVLNFLEDKKDFLFPNKQYADEEIEGILMEAPDEFEGIMRSIPFRKPSTLQIISIFPGSLGVDRFYLGDIKMGILKYFTFGGFGIWWLKDIFSAKERCRAYNCKKLMDAISDPAVVSKMQSADDSINKALQFAKAAAPVVKAAKDGMKDVGSTFYVK